MKYIIVGGVAGGATWYYNNIFAPGWTVASLWELLTPGRAEKFMKD